MSNVSDSVERPPLRVFVTVDVEMWPQSWDGYRDDFEDTFARYIEGRTSRGSVGLSFQLATARAHGLRFVFFVESLFASEFGIGPLADIVGEVRDAEQEVQLHAHPEWVAHASTPVFDTAGRYVFRDFSEEEQRRLIESGLENLDQAQARGIRAFRAGSFAANADTIAALSTTPLSFDSSFKLDSDTPYPTDISEYPLTTFEELPGRRRHLQLAACSFRELEHVLWEAYRLGWESVVVLSHSAEMLNADRTRPDRQVVERFERFCQLLADRPEFETAHFSALDGSVETRRPVGRIGSSGWRTGLRMLEQARGRWLF